MAVIDKATQIGRSIIHHGKLNDRIYLMEYDSPSLEYMLHSLNQLARLHDYGKIVAKVRDGLKDGFITDGYEEEAVIPEYYKNGENCCFMSKYNHKHRKIVGHQSRIKEILSQLKSKNFQQLKAMDDGFYIRTLGKKDAVEMVGIYKEVFETYPFPIHQVEYLQQTMENNILYFGVFHRSRLVGISSCEMNKEEKNVEMTDFAILKAYRGKKLARHLLKSMEKAMKNMDMHVAYTIARSISFPMNATFLSEGYNYTGTLWNNTQISGDIESMNVWYKLL